MNIIQSYILELSLKFDYMKAKFGLLLMIALFVTGGVFAQQRQRMTPEERAKSQTENLVKELGLTKEQKDKVHEIYLKYAQQPRPQRDSNSNSDRKTLMAEMQKQQLKRDSTIKVLLTDDQKKKYDELQKEMQDRMRNNTRRQR